MLIIAICFFIMFGLAILIGIPLSAMIVTLRAKLLRYLNRYYIVSRNGDGLYELHYRPAFGYYFAHEREFYRLTADAFRFGYPDLTLIATTLTQQSCRRKFTLVLVGE